MTYPVSRPLPSHAGQWSGAVIAPRSCGRCGEDYNDNNPCACPPRFDERLTRKDVPMVLLVGVSVAACYVLLLFGLSALVGMLR